MKRYIWLVAAAAAVALILLSLGSAMAQGQKFVLRVNAGDEKPFKDKAGNVWQPDKEYKKGGGYGFIGGDIVDRGSDMKIAGATDPKIYQTEHYSMDGFKAEVPNGKYTVRMHFAETYEGIDSEGPRVFEVKIQGQSVLKDFDIQKITGGVQKPLVREFKGIVVANGILDIVFVAKLQNPEVNGIEIIAE